MLIESHPGFKIVGEADNGSAALAILEKNATDIILLDLDLGPENGLDLLPKLLAVAQKARVLILTGTRSEENHRQAVLLGAMGIVHKEKASDHLIKAMEKVFDGEVWLDRSELGRFFSERSYQGKEEKTRNPEAAKIQTLTEREREVVTLIGEGLKNKQIAERLFISETTVRHHLSSVFSKLNVSDRLELVIYAYRHGLAKPPS
jgi:DNA-binding NarL/FixJ family response regulator